IPGNIHPYKLILPSQQIAAYIISEDSIIAHDAEKYARRDRVQPSDGTYVSVSDDGEYIVTEKTLYHKVKKKETLTSIAKRYGVTVASIREANGGIRKAKLNSLIKIKVVKRERRPKSEYDMRTDSLAIPDNGENVQNTDSISTVESNDSKADTVVVSPTQEKKVEEKNDNVKKKKKQDSQGPVYVTVRKGDNLSKIAQRNGTTVAKIKKLNNMKNDRINAGQKIRVK
ncbi:MAG: LysM peptidoglycan-binding domain-containing protein, partial [Muribaculaceae bacterium]